MLSRQWICRILHKLKEEYTQCETKDYVLFVFVTVFVSK